MPDASTAPLSADLRITPASLLLTSLIGTLGGAVVLLSIAAGVRAWIDVGMGEVGSAVFSPVALLLIGAIGTAILFLVGYRRHGRFVSTEVWAAEGTLRARVPEAWGRLIREHIRIEPRRVTTGPDEELVVTGPAQTWWDPGGYEVRIPADTSPKRTDALKRQLA